jgi:hypothetical protein
MAASSPQALLVAARRVAMRHISTRLSGAGPVVLTCCPPPRGPVCKRLPLSSGGGWQMPPIPLERLGPLGAIGAGVDLSRVRELLARRGPHPIGTYEQPAGPRNPRASQVPTVYITCGTHGDNEPMAPVVAAVRAAGIGIYVLHRPLH